MGDETPKDCEWGPDIRQWLYASLLLIALGLAPLVTGITPATVRWILTGFAFAVTVGAILLIRSINQMHKRDRR